MTFIVVETVWTRRRDRPAGRDREVQPDRPHPQGMSGPSPAGGGRRGSSRGQGRDHHRARGRASGSATPSGSSKRARRSSWRRSTRTGPAPRWGTWTARATSSSSRPTSPTRRRPCDCAAATKEHFGKVDILINNAALYYDIDNERNDYEYLRTVFSVNLHGAWLMARACAPHMVEQHWGRIINQSSGAAYLYNMVPPGDFHEVGVVQLQPDEVGRRRAHQAAGRSARPVRDHGELHRPRA